MTAAGRRSRPERWLDAGSFALGVLTEALAQLRRRPTPARVTRSGPASPLVIDPARRPAWSTRSRTRRPAARRPRRREP